MNILKNINWYIYIRISNNIYNKLTNLLFSYHKSEIFDSIFMLQELIDIINVDMPLINIPKFIDVIKLFIQENISYHVTIARIPKFKHRFIPKNYFFLKKSFSQIEEDWKEYVYMKLPKWYIQSLWIKTHIEDILIEDNNILLGLEKLQSSFELYDNQQSVKNLIINDNRNCLCIQAWPWWGKTILLFDLLCTYKQKSVIICNNSNLLKQIVNEFLEKSWLTKKDITILWSSFWVTWKNEDWSYKDIIFTLADWFKKLDKNINIWMILIDEIHETVSDKVLEKLNILSYKFLFWFSATPYIKFFNRDINKTSLIFWELIYWWKSPLTTETIIYTLQTDYLNANIKNLWKKVDINISENITKKKIYWYSHLRWWLLDDKERFLKILTLIEKETIWRKYIIILTDRIQEIESIKEFYLDKPVYYLNSSFTNKQKDEVMENWKLDWWILICISEVIKSWFNFKLLDTLILINHVSMKTWSAWISDLEQINWRLTRDHPDKITPPKFIIIDDNLYKKDLQLKLKKLKDLWSKTSVYEEWETMNWFNYFDNLSLGRVKFLSSLLFW